MGALHTGHLSLIRLAASQTPQVIVSIYLNPSQFGIHEDLSSYPQTLATDLAALDSLNQEFEKNNTRYHGRVGAVFLPSTSEMYPSGFPGQELDSKGSFVNITPLAETLEGRSRPTFFRGVATICMKLFGCVGPDKVYFGQKDAQQCLLVKKMVKDFLMPIDVVVGPTQRDEDGIALSSRNVYLGARRRLAARALSRGLSAAVAKYEIEGSRSRDEIVGAAREVMDGLLRVEMSEEPSKRALFEVGYISLGDPEDMEEIDVVDGKRGAIISGAIKLPPVEKPRAGEDLGHNGGPPVRLIDNMILKPSEQ